MMKTTQPADKRPMSKDRLVNGGVAEAEASVEIVKLLADKGLTSVQCVAALQAALVLCDYRQSSRMRMHHIFSGQYPDDPRHR